MGTRSANLGNDVAVRALKWTESDPARFVVKDSTGERKGLYVRVSKSGDKTWLLRYKRDGRQRWYSLGHYPATSVSDALSAYGAARARVRNGEDPAGEREATRAREKAESERDALTLSTVFDKHYLPRYAKSRKRTWEDDKKLFDRHIRKRLGKRPAEAITGQDLAKLLDPLAERAYHTARKVRALLNKIYSWARDNRSAVNPGDGPLLSCPNPCADYKLDSAPEPDPKRDRTLKHAEIRKLWKALGDSNAGRILRLQLLTGCRAIEVCGMQEAELDRDAREWTIPAARSKNKRSHVVPLTDTMLEIIGAPDERAIFPSRGKAGHTTPSGAYQTLKEACTAAKVKAEGIGTHTLRKTFTTELARLEIPRDLRDRLTNHADSSVDARHYNKHDYVAQKRRALERWDNALRAIIANRATVGNVVEFRRQDHPI